MDVLIEAAGRLAPGRPDLTVAIGGTGRDARRLATLIEATGAPVRLLGRVGDDDVPALNGAADVWAMLCRNRWLGLEQEGFGLVFLEAAACGVAAVAGRSGGADEAVVHEVTGLVADRPGDVVVVTESLRRLLDDEPLRQRLGAAARTRVLEQFEFPGLVGRLAEALAAAGG
jgi:phosphatidylinositol alpha-1,6-mannosyltransferase